VDRTVADECDRSVVIDHLETKQCSMDTLCTFYYCEYNERNDQTVVNLLSSLLQQLLHQLPNQNLPPDLVSLYNLHKRYDTRPTVSQIKAIFEKETSRLDKVYVILDALDEYAESYEEALEVVSTIRSLSSRIKLLCTSRSSAVFDSYFEGCAALKVSAKKDDIEAYLTSHLQKHHRLTKHVRADPKLKDDIVNTISNECRGM
jgi:hypothetical protein